MARRKKRQGSNELNLDSLMDILTCSVGVMVVVVVVAVLDARGASINLALPFARPAPDGVDRTIVTVLDGRLRLLDLDAAFDHVKGTRKNTYESLPGQVRRANEAPFTDGYFDYHYSLRSSQDWSTRYRWIEITITERADAPGFTLEQLSDSPEAFLELVDRLGNGDEVWVTFQIDANDESIALFREARALLATRNIATGWDPTAMTFPMTQTLYKPGPTASSNSAPGPGQTLTN